MIGVLLAVPDIASEADIVAVAPSCGLRIVRRCVDAIDLFAAAASDPAPVAVVSAGLPRLAADVVERLRATRPAGVVGLAADAESAERLRVLGVSTIVTEGPDPQATAHALRACAIDRVETSTRPPDPSGVWSTGVWSAEPTDVGGSVVGRSDTGPAASPLAAADREQPGRLIAVWGPAGAPGRTTVAMGVAEAAAESGSSVCLVDADTYAPSVTMALGLVEEASGIVVACRHADNGTLSPTALLSAASRVRGPWFVLGGIGRPERWAELRPGALERVWAACRETFDLTVVDVGFCLEGDDSGAWSRRRNAAAIGAVCAADGIVAVADSSALGAARLASAWPALTSLAPSGQVTVVQNRAGGRGHERLMRWSEGLADIGIPARVHRVPLDERAASSCWRRGRSVGEGARRSALRRSLADVAATLVSG